MPTLLTTRKMSPELSARIAARVTGRVRRAGPRRRPQLFVALFRLCALLVIVLLAATLVRARQRANQQLEDERRAVLGLVSRHASRLTLEDFGIVERAESALVRESGAYAGDRIPSELGSAEALVAVLQASFLYLRGAQPELQQRSAIAQAAQASRKDAFVPCLLDPPEERSETALVRRLYLEPRQESRGARAYPLSVALAGLPFLSTPFAERVRSAPAMPELLRLERVLERAPLAEAADALKARRLLFVIDEPGSPGTPTELDGEKAHAVRVGLFDLNRDRLLFRVRKAVDPAWIASAKHREYATDLDSCVLALDIRAALPGQKRP